MNEKTFDWKDMTFSWALCACAIFTSHRDPLNECKTNYYVYNFDIYS